MMTILSLLRRFRRDRSGLSAIEFALIVPVMLISLIGAVEVSNGMLADRKLTQTAATVADLVAQRTTINAAQVTEIFNAANAIMAPVDTTSMCVRVSSILQQTSSQRVVEWTELRGNAGMCPPPSVVMPANLIAVGETIIKTEISLTFEWAFTRFSRFGWEPVQISEEFFLKPRRSVRVQRVS